MEMHAGSLYCLILVICAEAFGRGSYRWKEQFDNSWDDSKLEKPWQDEYPYDWFGNGEKQEVDIYENYRPAYEEPPPTYSRLSERPRRAFHTYEYETAIPKFDDDSTMWYLDDDQDSMAAPTKSRTGRSNALVGQMLSPERLVDNDDWFEKPSGGSQGKMAVGSSADSFQPYFDVLRNDKQPSLLAEVKAFLGPMPFRKRKLARSPLKEDGTKLHSEKPAVEISDDNSVNEKEQTTKQLIDLQDERKSNVEDHEEKVTEMQVEQQKEPKEKEINAKDTGETATTPSGCLMDKRQKEDITEPEEKGTEVELQPTTVGGHEQEGAIKEDQEEAKPVQTEEAHDGEPVTQDGDSSDDGADSRHVTVLQTSPPQLPDEGSLKRVERQKIDTPPPAIDPPAKMDGSDVEGNEQQTTKQLANPQDGQQPDDVEKEYQVEQREEDFGTKITEEAASAPSSHLTDEEQKEAVSEPEKKTTEVELQPIAVESDRQEVSIKEDQEEAKGAQEGIHQEQSEGSEPIRGSDSSAERRGPEEKPGHMESLCPNVSKAGSRKIRQIAPSHFLDGGSSKPVEMQQMRTSLPATEPTMKMGKINDSDVEHAWQLTTKQLPDYQNFQNEQKLDVQDVGKEEKQEEAKGEKLDVKTMEEAVSAPWSRLMEDKQIEAVSGSQDQAMAVEHQSTALESDKREPPVQENQKEPKMIQKRSDQQQLDAAYSMQGDDFSAGHGERDEKTGLLKQYNNAAVSRHVYVPQTLVPRFSDKEHSKPVEEKQMEISLPARYDFDWKTKTKQGSQLSDFTEERLRRITVLSPQKLPEQKQQVTSEEPSSDHQHETVLSPEVLNEKAAEAILSRDGSSFMEMKGKTWTDRSRYYKEDPILVTFGRREKSPSHSVIEMDGKKWKYPTRGSIDEKTKEGKRRVVIDQSLELPRILANIDNPVIVGGRGGFYARPVYMAAAGVMDTVSKTAEKPQLDDMGQVEEREKKPEIPESSGDSRKIVETKSAPGEQIQSAKSDPIKNRDNKPERVETPFVPLWSQNEQKWIELADKMMKSKLDGSYDRRFRRAGGSRPQKIFTEV